MEEEYFKTVDTKNAINVISNQLVDKKRLKRIFNQLVDIKMQKMRSDLVIRNNEVKNYNMCLVI